MSAVTVEQGTGLELDDIQIGALHERPSPYVGTYLLLRIDDPAAGRALVRRLLPLVDSGRSTSLPEHGAWITVAFTYSGLKALGVPQESLDSFAPEFQQGMAARAAELGDVGDSHPSNWEAPLGTSDVHVAVAVLSPDAARLEAAAEKARRAHKELAGVELIWRQDCYQLPNGRTSFGFKDGIGQPAVEGSGTPVPQFERRSRSRPVRSSSATPTRPASCRRCRRRRCSVATAPTWSSASCTPGWRRTGSTCARRPPAARTRRCSAPRWSGAGRAEPR